MKRLNIRLVALVIIAGMYSSGCSNSALKYYSSKRVKNVILIIGDGMGLAQLYGAMSIYQDPMNIEKVNIIGFSETQSYNDYVTDSGAGGTAISTGQKTRNGMIGLGPDSTMLVNMVELAHRNNKTAGVVSTSSVTHATPASFVAHNINRNNYEEIALDFLKTEPDVFIGGGRANFESRDDKRNLLNELKDAGYDVVLTIEELLEADSYKLAGLLADEHMPTIAEGRGDMLAYSTIKAIETLQKDPDGFFLMIEASQIDWAAHEHDTRYIIEETIDLDRTLGVVLDYAERLGETLVIVTADHETGGMTLVSGDLEKNTLTASYSVGVHTGITVPVYAFGPASYEFNGFYQNTELFEKIIKVLSFK